MHERVIHEWIIHERIIHERIIHERLIHERIIHERIDSHLIIVDLPTDDCSITVFGVYCSTTVLTIAVLTIEKLNHL